MIGLLRANQRIAGRCGRLSKQRREQVSFININSRKRRTSQGDSARAQDLTRKTFLKQHQAGNCKHGIQHIQHQQSLKSLSNKQHFGLPYVCHAAKVQRYVHCTGRTQAIRTKRRPNLACVMRPMGYVNTSSEVRAWLPKGNCPGPGPMTGRPFPGLRSSIDGVGRHVGRNNLLDKRLVRPRRCQLYGQAATLRGVQLVDRLVFGTSNARRGLSYHQNGAVLCWAWK